METEHKHTEEKKENHSHDTVHEHKSGETKHEHKNMESKPEHKTEEKKVVKHIAKKDVAVANAYGVHISKRHGMYISSFIKGKSIDKAISDLEEVIMFKKAVPFKGEIPHRKGKGMMSGRYPVAASKIFIPLLKTLKGNASVNGLDIDKTRISLASTNLASRPQRRGGEKGKRAHILLEAREIKLGGKK